MPGPVVGGKCKLYYSVATDTETWLEICSVGDVSIPDMTTNLAEISTRCTPWITNLPAQMTLAVEFALLYGAEAAVFDFLRGAFFAQTNHLFAIMDGDITVDGTEGLVAPFFIENFPITQNLEEASMVDTVRLALAYEENGGSQILPEWRVITVP